MKLRWDSPFSPYSHGVRCDVCGKENDPEGSMYWPRLITGCGNWDYCSPDCLKAHMEVYDFNHNAPPRDKNYLGGCRGYDIKCSFDHPEERRMLAPDKPAPPGWILFECDCGNYRYLEDTEAHRNVAKYSRRR